MKSNALRSSIWIVNLILLSLAVSLYHSLSLYYYSAYSLNSVFLIEFFDIGVKDCPTGWMANTKIALLSIANCIAIYIFWSIRKLLILIKNDGPFESSVVPKMQAILKWTIVFGVVKLFASIIIEMITGDLRIVLNSNTLIILFLIGIIYVLVEVFKHGVAIRSEYELTI